MEGAAQGPRLQEGHEHMCVCALGLLCEPEEGLGGPGTRRPWVPVCSAAFGD